MTQAARALTHAKTHVINRHRTFDLRLWITLYERIHGMSNKKDRTQRESHCEGEPRKRYEPPALRKKEKLTEVTGSEPMRVS